MPHGSTIKTGVHCAHPRCLVPDVLVDSRRQIMFKEISTWEGRSAPDSRHLHVHKLLAPGLDLMKVTLPDRQGKLCVFAHTKQRSGAAHGFKTVWRKFQLRIMKVVHGRTEEVIVDMSSMWSTRKARTFPAHLASDSVCRTFKSSKSSSGSEFITKTFSCLLRQSKGPSRTDIAMYTTRNGAGNNERC